MIEVGVPIYRKIHQYIILYYYDKPIIIINIKHYKFTVKRYRRFSEINFEILHRNAEAHIVSEMVDRPTVYLSIKLNCSIYLKQKSGSNVPKENK